jgi:hypothetical protein
VNLRKDHYHTHTHACDFCWHVILRGRHAGLGWAAVGGCGRGSVFRSLPRSGHGRSRRSLGAGGEGRLSPAAPEGWHAMGFLVAPRTMDTPVTRLKLCLSVGSGRHHTHFQRYLTRFATSLFRKAALRRGRVSVPAARLRVGRRRARSGQGGRTKKNNTSKKTFSGGCLGSRNDEERSEMRYVMRIAESSESSRL